MGGMKMLAEMGRVCVVWVLWLCCTAVAGEHAFLREEGLPRWSAMTAQQVMPDVEVAVAEAQQRMQAIASLRPEDATFENTFLAYDAAEEDLKQLQVYLYHLVHTMGSAEYEAAHEQVIAAVAAYEAQRPAMGKIYELMQHVAQQVQGASDEQRLFMARTLQQLRDAGAALSAADAARKVEIEAELQRDGQVYFIHNRVEDLMTIKGMLMRLCPEARVGVAHGQMKPAELEKTIMDFIYHDFDILVATSIVESGVDIPNVNTIVINEADRFGLSNLHQLRGRVGRSDRKAYCYLLSRPDEMLPSDARRRLRAIEEFSDLGSGFNIAMQDLDIRGAGNLLGAEQSGFIANIGFETYQKILNEAIAELRAEGLDVAGLSSDEQTVVDEMRYVNDVTLELDVEAELPEAYVRQQAERLKLYRKIDAMADEESLVKFESELEDRFGKMPQPAKELMNAVRLRWEAMRLGLERVKVKNGLMIVRFVGDDNSPYYRSEVFMEVLRKITAQPDRFVLKQRDGKLAMTVRRVDNVAAAVDVLKGL